MIWQSTKVWKKLIAYLLFDWEVHYFLNNWRIFFFSVFLPIFLCLETLGSPLGIELLGFFLFRLFLFIVGFQVISLLRSNNTKNGEIRTKSFIDQPQKIFVKKRNKIWTKFKRIFEQKLSKIPSKLKKKNLGRIWWRVWTKLKKFKHKFRHNYEQKFEQKNFRTKSFWTKNSKWIKFRT